MGERSNQFMVSLATLGKVGMMPKAPGTWGSLFGIPVGLGMQWVALGRLPLIGVYWTTLLFAALWIIHRAEKVLNTHDDSRIVLDEVVGQAFIVAFLPMDFFHVVAAFVTFRVFDIWKPGPIGWVDAHVPGAWGTLLDDVVAAFVSLPVIILAAYLFTTFF